MSDYIQRGPMTRNRNHLMVEVIPVCCREETWQDRCAPVIGWLLICGVAALAVAMATMSLQGLI